MSIVIIFLISGFMYAGMEVALDNTSDRSMILVGGFIFSVAMNFDEWIGVTISYPYSFSRCEYWLLCLIIAFFITILEYIAGRIFNKNYQIWDYRKMSCNFDGQICLTFFLVWFLGISHIIIYLGNKLTMIF